MTGIEAMRYGEMAYLIAPLEIIVEQGSWLSRDLTLPQWIERLLEDEDDR